MSEYLKIHSPSPTAVDFTVSNRAPTSSRPLRFLSYAVRLCIAYQAVTLAVASLQLTYTDAGLDPALEKVLSLTLIRGPVRSVVLDLDWWIVTVSSLLVLFLCVRTNSTEESLLVVQGLGVQTSTSSPYFFLGPTTTFIPTTQIQDIVIHEAFKGFGVRFYLAIIVEGATEVVVVFPTLLPKRLILEDVWRGARKCLYGGGR